MPNQRARQLMIENLQDSLRLVRHLMQFSVEKFAEAIGVTRQTVNNLETKKTKMSATQYIAISALADSWFSRNKPLLPALKAILDSEDKNYGAEYKTVFLDDSLVKRWFKDLIEEDSDEEDLSDALLESLTADYKIILDAATLESDDTEIFVKNLTAALRNSQEKIIVPLRSIEELDENSCRAKKFLKQLQEAGVLQIHGEETDPDFYDTALSVFARFRNKYKLCLITPNKDLANEILRLNDSVAEDDFSVWAGEIVSGKFRFYFGELLNLDEPESWTEL